MNMVEIFQMEPYSLHKTEKEELMSSCLTKLSKHHYLNCEAYKKIVDGAGFDLEKVHHPGTIPFLPVQLFKNLELYSVPKKEIVKTLTSSGTSGQKVSQIFLDKGTAVNQTKVLCKIATSFIGDQRLPMIILDTESTVEIGRNIAARAAGILGFSLFGSERMYALDEQMELNIEQLQAFLKKHQGERILLFGFTYIVYMHFYKALVKSGVQLDLSNAVLIHGGGWKKLAHESILPQEFRYQLNVAFGIQHIHDYYGMAEQTGSIAMECEFGYYHTSIFSEIIIRRAQDFSIAHFGEEGIIQTLSILPQSYPGHSLLTTDNGIMIGEDDCACGRLGKYFKITGRMKNVEIRGCSDTYEQRFR